VVGVGQCPGGLRLELQMTGADLEVDGRHTVD
jgi:hypothetical protein